MNVSVSSLRKANTILGSGSFTGLISIGVRGKDHCEKRTGNDLLLDFHDVTPVSWTQWVGGVTAGDVIKIIDFGRALTHGDLVLCHSLLGRSRSTAAAIILYLAAGKCPVVACKNVFAPYPRSTPNWLMLAIADHLLDTHVLEECRNSYKVKSSKRDRRV